MNRFPADFPANLTGFGGEQSMTKVQHRAALRKTPVVLVHGNAGHSAHPRWGMETMRDFLLGEGYSRCEIWAMDYLGEGNTATILQDVHIDHIDAFRSFVDSVRDYLGVLKLDFIAHSLGCGMVNGYLRGVQKPEQWDNEAHRLDTVGTFVAIAGANHGLGRFAIDEFKTGGAFETTSHKFDGVVDDTTRGSNDKAAQDSPVSGWTGVTELDNGAIRYAAMIAASDFVEMQNPGTGRLEGADLIRQFDLGSADVGHEKIIKSKTVFNEFKGMLNKHPPAPPATIAVDKASGSHASGLVVMADVTPDTVALTFHAQCITQRFNAGFIQRTVADTREGTLSDGGSLTLATNGMWEVVFQAAGAEDVRRSYGVGVVLPEVTILTDNAAPFDGSLAVVATTTRGVLHHSTDQEHWNVGSQRNIDRTGTVSFIAIDSDGIASPVVNRPYKKRIEWTDAKTATLTQHFIAHRTSVNDYVAWGMELGFNAILTLYLVDEQWVRNVEGVQSAVAVARAAMAAAHPQRSASADRPDGDYAGALDVTLTAPKGTKVYYTEDGSDPSDAHNARRVSFDGQKAFRFERAGRHAVLCHVPDGKGGGAFEAFVWTILS